MRIAFDSRAGLRPPRHRPLRALPARRAARALADDAEIVETHRPRARRRLPLAVDRRRAVARRRARWSSRCTTSSRSSAPASTCAPACASACATWPSSAPRASSCRPTPSPRDVVERLEHRPASASPSSPRRPRRAMRPRAAAEVAAAARRYGLPERLPAVGRRARAPRPAQARRGARRRPARAAARPRRPRPSSGRRSCRDVTLTGRVSDDDLAAIYTRRPRARLPLRRRGLRPAGRRGARLRHAGRRPVTCPRCARCSATARRSSPRDDLAGLVAAECGRAPPGAGSAAVDLGRRRTGDVDGLRRGHHNAAMTDYDIQLDVKYARSARSSTSAPRPPRTSRGSTRR